MSYDAVLRNGLVHDGRGAEPRRCDIGIAGDRIAALGDLSDAGSPALDIDANGLAVAPGFINVLSHAYYSILVDGLSQSDLRQGVTTEIFGEGWSMGPWTEEMRERVLQRQEDYRFEVPWLRLREYLEHVEHRGCTQNVASFIGAATVREHVIGHEQRPATPAETSEMQRLVAEEMAEGALGVASALIYPPGTFADTDELTALCSAAARHGGSYCSHLRSEGDRLVEAVEELVEIARRAGAPAEVYHLKAIGAANWHKMDVVVEHVEEAREAGLAVSADVYPYIAGCTSLAYVVPPQLHHGDTADLAASMRDHEVRRRARDLLERPGEGWENLLLASGGGEGVLITSAHHPEAREFLGMTLAEAAAQRGSDVVDTLLDLLAVDSGHLYAAFFMISEDNLRRQLQLPWVSLGSDGESVAISDPFTRQKPHPRTYGTFARFLGRYVRDERLLPLPEAIRRLSSLPARNLGLVDRGELRPGAFADIVVFDPATVSDQATYAEPHQYATGVRDVLVNGVCVLRDGEPTGSFGGRALRRGRP